LAGAEPAAIDTVKRFIAATGLALLFVPPVFARTRVAPEQQRGQSLLARVTVYWAGGGRGSDSYTRRHQCSTGVRLRVGHCAVDPRRIPYGSKVVLLDGVYTAVDTGRAVINRKAARRAGRTASERNAPVIDCFFETKRQALSWANAHPAFMTVQVVAPNCYRTTPAQRPQVSKQPVPQVAAGNIPQTKRIAGGKQAAPQVASGTVPQTKWIAGGKQPAPQVAAGTVPQAKRIAGGKQPAPQVAAGTVPQTKRIVGTNLNGGSDRVRR
jgi:3D (Asp-Asp-Asp) domain-containing protein